MDKAREAIDSGAEEHCPTCHREFESGEQAEISDTLRRQAAAIRRRAARETKRPRSSPLSRQDRRETREMTSNLNRWRELREARVEAEDRVSARLETFEKPGPTWRSSRPHHDTEAPATPTSKRPAPAATA